MTNNVTLRSLSRTLIQDLDGDLEYITAADYPHDLMHEYAEQALPVWNHSLASCLAADPFLAEVEDPGLLGDNPDVWQILRISIYEQLLHVAYEWLSENGLDD